MSEPAYNPYSPPQAAVADAADLIPIEKPPQVGRAARILWATLGLGLVNAAVQWRVFAAMPFLVFILLMQALALGIYAWLIAKMSAGRNWARITYLVLSLLGLPMVVLQLPVMFARTPLAAVISVVGIGLQVWALCLIFSRAARPWFRR